MKPYIRDFVPSSFADIPDVTAYEAGYLVTKTQVGAMSARD